MKDVYRGREQTYVKHFFLEHYLERVGYVIGNSYGSFVYVDGFSGPWQSADGEYEDTSFMIAVNKLRQVRDGLIQRGRRPNIRCLFVEKDPLAYAALEGKVSTISDLDVKALQGEFADLVPEILRYVGRTFSLTFIDPTGWTGFPLDRITPILHHKPGEVLINFMYDFYNRFSATSEHKAAFTEMMGGPGFEGLSEEETIALYSNRVRDVGGFKHVTSTRIKKPTAERSYFHLIYGTRHVKGLEEFRAVEEKTIATQESVRLAARDLERVARTRQPGLFTPDELPGQSLSFEQEFVEQQKKAEIRLDALLDERGRVSYEYALGELLEFPLVWEKAVKRIIGEMQKASRLSVEGLKERELTVKKGCFLVRR